MVYPSWAAACLAPCSALVKKGSLVCFGISTITLDVVAATEAVAVPPPALVLFVPVLHAVSATDGTMPIATAACHHLTRCLRPSMCPPFGWSAMASSDGLPRPGGRRVR